MQDRQLLVAAVAIVCCIGSLSAQSDQPKIDPSKTKTLESAFGDVQTSQTQYFDEKGVPVKTEKTTITPEGTSKETEVYRPNNVTVRTTVQTDNFGKEIQTTVETYKDGKLVAGTITGPKLWKVFNPDTGTYENWKPVKPFYNMPGGWTVAEPKTATTPKPSETPATMKKVSIGGELELRYDYDHKDSHEGDKTIGMAPNGKPTMNQFVARGAVKIDIVGTGETIGHIADAKIENVSHENANFYFPPAVLESKSGKNQDYVAPRGQDVALKPGESKTIPIDGTCLERNRPPEPAGQGGDLVLDDGTWTSTKSDWFNDQPEVVRNILRIVEAKYEEIDREWGEGVFKDFPYSDPKKCKDIAVQWSTWEDPRIAELVGGPPTNKDDFKKVINDQAKKHGPVSRDTRKRLDKGADDMWDTIELTSEKAKDLEHPTTTENVSDETPTPAPEWTKEKFKEWKNELKKLRDDWKTKEKLFYATLLKKAIAQQKYDKALKDFYEKDERWKKANAKRDAESKKGTLLDNPNFADAIIELTDIEVKLEREFKKIEEGKKLAEELKGAQAELDKADTDQKQAKEKYDKKAPAKVLEKGPL
jgi:hypothetical protein